MKAGPFLVILLALAWPGCMEEKPFPRASQQPGTVETLPGPGESSPAGPAFQMDLRQDAGAARLVVEEADSEADWSRVELRSSDGAIRFALNATPDNTSRPVEYAQTWIRVRDSSHGVSSGDTLGFCAERTDRVDVTVALRVAEAGTDLGTFGFPDVPGC